MIYDRYQKKGRRNMPLNEVVGSFIIFGGKIIYFKTVDQSIL